MNAGVLQITAKILPILLLIALGNLLRWKRVIGEHTAADLKTVVINLALPSVFFLSFLELELDTSYLALVGLMICLCGLQFFYGKGVQRLFRIPEPYFPHLATAFELGMVGITLFGAAYGLDRVGAVGVLGIGHELFVWFILVTLLISRRDGVARLGGNVKRFLTSPVILSIFAGILANALGLRELLRGFVLTAALLATMEYLSRLTIPLILVIVGYGMKFSAHELKRPLAVIAARLVLLVPLALLLNRFLVLGALGLDPVFAHALFTVMILPPPFIIPLYIHENNLEDMRFANNTLTMHTVATIVVFITYLLVTPG